MSTSKTPVSILHEYMLRLGHTPKYDLVTTSKGHDTFFEIVVSAGRVQETGSGRSKKEAKHNAAQKALDKLANSNDTIRAELLITSGITTEKAVSALVEKSTGSVAVSPYAEQVTENSVGALAELCAQHHLDDPVYELIGESGPPHSKTFSMCCKVITLKEQGVARTKKQAKQISAKKMIEKINEHLAMASSSIISSGVKKQKEKVTFEEKNYKMAIDGYRAIKEKDQGSTAGRNMSQILSKSHLSLRDMYGHQLSTLRAYASSHLPKETLTKFAEGNDVPLSFSFVRSNRDGYCLCAASLSSTPELVKFGEGTDAAMAEEIAAINLLQALMIMIADAKEEE